VDKTADPHAGKHFIGPFWWSSHIPSPFYSGAFCKAELQDSRPHDQRTDVNKSFKRTQAIRKWPYSSFCKILQAVVFNLIDAFGHEV